MHLLFYSTTSPTSPNHPRNKHEALKVDLSERPILILDDQIVMALNTLACTYDLISHQQTNIAIYQVLCTKTTDLSKFNQIIWCIATTLSSFNSKYKKKMKSVILFGASCYLSQILEGLKNNGRDKREWTCIERWTKVRKHTPQNDKKISQNRDKN